MRRPPTAISRSRAPSGRSPCIRPVVTRSTARSMRRCTGRSPSRGAGLGGAQPGSKPNPALGVGDVTKALKTYLRRYNHGRGFVLIGHSQGAGVLEAVIAKSNRPQARGSQAPAVGDPDGWQRAGEGQHRHRGRLQAHPGVSARDSARMRDRVLHVRPAGPERQHVRTPGEPARDGAAAGRRGALHQSCEPGRRQRTAGPDPAERAVRARFDDRPRPRSSELEGPDAVDRVLGLASLVHGAAARTPTARTC